MLELQNAREREIDDWASLFAQADGRFKFLGGKKPDGSNLWIMEAVWESAGEGHDRSANLKVEKDSSGSDRHA